MLKSQQVAPETFSQVLARHPGADSAFLKVAEGGLYTRPTVVQTVLGSCLAAAMFAPARSVGCIFHAFLPSILDYQEQERQTAYKYVDSALEQSLLEFARLGIAPKDLRVCLVGGANALADSRGGVGGRNVSVAREVLASRGMRAHYEDVGGPNGRKVFFVTSTGELRVHALHGLPQEHAAHRRV